MSDLEDLDALFRLDGKVALITGSRGLGFHTATAFLRAGARKVILVARNAHGEHGLDRAVECLNSLQGIRGQVISFAIDISTISGIEDLVARVRETEDHLDILVANAAATWGGPFEANPDSASGRILDLNVRSVFNMIRLTIPLLAAAGTSKDPARVVLVGSVAGFMVPHVGDNGTIMYAISKAAVHHLARQMAVELGPRNITTNAIAPGFFPTKLANGLIQILGGAQKLSAINPRRRLGEPIDIAGVMLFLCSAAGSYVNGAVIPLDGGENLTAGIKTKI